MVRNLHIAIVLIIAASAVACGARGGVATPRPFPGAPLPPTSQPAPPQTAGVEPGAAVEPVAAPPLVATALTFRGTPYRNGGSDPSGFDCSGFVQWVFAMHGLRLPREVREQYRVGGDIDVDDVQPGDLVFFETVSRGASHVGIAIGGGEFVHAPSSRGVVRIERFTNSYWAQRWVGARRVL